MRAGRLHSSDVTVHKGIPVTTIARLLVDLTDELTKWELANVAHEAEFREIFSLRATEAARGRAATHHRRTRTKNEDANKEAAWRAGGYEVLRFSENELRAATGAVDARAGVTGSSC